MNSPTPTRVVMYTIAAKIGTRTPIGEFRYDPRDGVTFTKLDPEWGSVAQGIYDNGTLSRDHNRFVRKEEGPDFMRTLTEPNRTTYYGFIDLSNVEDPNTDQPKS